MDDVIIGNESIFSFSVASLLADYGWYLLIGVIICLYIYKQLQPNIQQYWNKKADQEYAEKYHKDPDIAIARATAQEAAVLKLQEKYARDAEDHQKRMEEKQAKKREEWLLNNSEKGHRLGNKSTGAAQTSLKAEYNPLMGGTSQSYRAPKRSCPGGGCGK